MEEMDYGIQKRERKAVQTAMENGRWRMCGANDSWFSHWPMVGGGRAFSILSCRWNLGRVE